MSDINKKTLATDHEQITVTVDTENIRAAFEKKVKQQAKQADMPGFRKGMVPASLIKRAKGDILFTQELFQHVEKELTAYLEKEKYELLGQPLMMNVPEGITHREEKKYAFTFEVGKRPSFETPDITQHTIEKPLVEITDDILQNEIQMQQRKYGAFKETEKVESEDDILHLSFLEWDENKKESFGKETTDVLLVKYFHKDTAKQLIGKKVSDTITVQLQKAFEKKELDWIINDLKIKDQEKPEKKHYQLTLTKIGHITPVAINEDLYKKVYPQNTLKNEEEFKEKLTADLNNSLQLQVNSYRQEQVYQFWLDETKMDLPVDFLKKWYIQNESKDNSKSQEEIEKQFIQFLPQLKWSIISEALAKDIKIEVDKQEIMQAMKEEVIRNYGATASEKQQHEAIQQLLSNSDYIYSTQQRIRNQKLLHWGLEKAKVKEIKMSLDDFTKKVESKK